jgi:hypothetical protein
MVCGWFLLWCSLASGAEQFGGYGFYIGDPHVHTGASGDGGSTDLGVCEGTCGAVAELAGIARANGLDWISVTDHVNGEWAAEPLAFARVHAAVLEAHDPEGGFVTLPGAELWFEDPTEQLGHKNLYLGADNATLRSLQLSDVQHNGERIHVDDCDTIWDWAERVEAAWGPIALVPHHPGMAMGMGTAWRCHEDPRAQALAPSVEIYSRHGNSVDCPSGWDPLWMDCDEERSVERALDPDGFDQRLGFMAGTDAHDTLPGAVCSHDTEMPNHPYGGGLTIAVIHQDQPFDRGPLLEAIQRGETYASSGPMLPALVRYSADGAELGGMGDRLRMPPDAALEVLVQIPAEHEPSVVKVKLQSSLGSLETEALGGGEYRASIEADELPSWLFPRIELDGESWHQEPCQDGGMDQREVIWLSPSFPLLEWNDSDTPRDSEAPRDSDTPGDSPPEDSEPPPGDRCGGCGWGGAGPAAGLALALLALPWGLRRRGAGGG